MKPRFWKALKSSTEYNISITKSPEKSSLLNTTMSKGKLFVWLLGIFILCGGIWYIFFRFTPLNGLLPMKLNNSTRAKFTELTLKADSLAEALAINDQYLNNIEALLGDSLTVIANNDSLGSSLYDLPLDSLLTAGKAEERFVKRFEASERFNLSVLSPIAAEGMVFYPPVSGMSLKSNAASADMPALTINDRVPMPISSIYRGTVVDAYYATDKGVTIVIQHPNNFISQYSGLGDVFVSRGSKVNAGARIGMTSGERYPFNFMMWHDGSPLDPAEYIQEPSTMPKADDSEPFIPTKKRHNR